MRHRPEPRGFAAQVWTSMPADQAGGEWFETVQAAQPVLWGPVIRGRRPCAHCGRIHAGAEYRPYSSEEEQRTFNPRVGIP